LRGPLTSQLQINPIFPSGQGTRRARKGSGIPIPELTTNLNQKGRHMVRQAHHPEQSRRRSLPLQV